MQILRSIFHAFGFLSFEGRLQAVSIAGRVIWVRRRARVPF